jgi:type III restriction enzyme
MTERSIDDGLIINSPYEEPQQYWAYSREEQAFKFKNGRRSAGYWKASQNTKSYDDPGEFIEIQLVNRIRPRVRDWKRLGYPNVTATTKRLLDYWQSPDHRSDGKRFFFAQLEAVETAIWLAEASPADRQGIEIPSDGSEWLRLCFKLATGVGKTNVMGMLIAWHALNKIANGKDTRFSKNILVIAPGITVRDRLSVAYSQKIGHLFAERSATPG